MSIEFEIKQKENMLIVAPDGTTDSVDDLMSYIDGFLLKSDELGAQKIILDHRNIVVHMEHAGAYDIATRCIKRMTDDRTLRIAVVARPERMEFARIYESIGVNRGVSIKAFESVTMASSWLAL